jgi:hypothetical protein
MKETCPAVVHLDGTARPQLVSADTNPLIHEVLSIYKLLTNKLAIVNTSFNVHEEPIVCSIEDALRGFFESGLDYLYIENIGIISFSENKLAAIHYLKEKIRNQTQKHKLDSVEKILEVELHERTRRLERVSKDLRERTKELVETRQELADRTARLEQISIDLVDRTKELVETRCVLVERTDMLEEITKDLVDRTRRLESM